MNKADVGRQEPLFKRIGKQQGLGGREYLITERDLRERLDGAYKDLDQAIAGLKDGSIKRLQNDFAYYERA